MQSRARRIAAVATLGGVMTIAACASPVGRETSRVGAATRLPPVTSTGEVTLAEHVTPSPTTDTHAAARHAADLNQPFVTPERLERGYTIVVVGVNGDNMLSAGLAPGLVEGGYPGAVEVVDWTTGYWPLFVYHLRAGSRHRAGAQLINDKIAAYQARYPRREVNLVGYSAGATVAVQAVEEMNDGRQIDRVVLLAGAISPLHDMRSALARVRLGVWNYHQPQDVVALWAGTLLAGTADGHHIVSAGAVGFWQRAGWSDAERRLYREKLVQIPYRPQMLASGNLGGHFQCTGHKFVAQWISPLLTGDPSASIANSADAKLR